MVEYTKKELFDIVTNLEIAVGKLCEVDNALKPGDYNHEFGYPKFLSQAQNYLTHYKSKLGELVIEEQLKEAKP